LSRSRGNAAAECGRRRYKTALRAFYARHGAAGVFFEVGRASAKGGHAHVQALPVPADLAARVEGAFREMGDVGGVGFEEESGQQGGDAEEARAGSYFRVELPDGRRLVHWMREGASFNLQFGRCAFFFFFFFCPRLTRTLTMRIAFRQAVATLLGLEDRVDWKMCAQSDEDDTADAQAFKTAFAPFAPDA
jgi:hypothetical protein